MTSPLQDFAVVVGVFFGGWVLGIITACVALSAIATVTRKARCEEERHG